MRIDRIFMRDMLNRPPDAVDGGKGSGNWGHKGRPGERGGSGKGGSSKGGGLHYRGAKFKHIPGAELSKLINEHNGSNDGRLWDTKPLTQKVSWMKSHLMIPQSEEAQKAYRAYSYKWDGRMNWLLRGGIEKSYEHKLDEYQAYEDQTREYIDTLTDDIANSPLPGPIVVRRGFSTVSGAVSCLGLNISTEDFMARIDNDPNFTDGLVGYTFRDNGFMSTSIGTGFGGKVQLEIFCPENTCGVYMADNSEFHHEQEFLLQRGSQLAITGYDKKPDGSITLKCSVVSQEPQPIPDEYRIVDNPVVPSVYDPKKVKKPTEPPKPATPQSQAPELAGILPKKGLWDKVNGSQGTFEGMKDINAFYPEVQTAASEELENIAEMIHDNEYPQEDQKDAFESAKLQLQMEVFSGNLLAGEAADILAAVTYGTEYEKQSVNFKENVAFMTKMYGDLASKYTPAQKFGDAHAAELDAKFPKASNAFKFLVGTTIYNPAASFAQKVFASNTLSHIWKTDYEHMAEDDGQVYVPLF